uniref:Ionotropic receptor 41a.1 n=1 Tax=Apolygus lucorum TaxID=248454 RepID=A0A7S5FGM7_APOLU|nr:ionotropic receptor 41a.1 [Apolygus lucorum]
MEGIRIVMILEVALLFSGSTKALNFTQNTESIEDALTTLAEEISTKYYVQISKGCIVLMTRPGFMGTFSVPGAAIIRLVSDNFCNDTDALNAMVTVFDEMCYNFIVQISEVHCFFKVWLDAQWKTIQRWHPEILFLPAYPEQTETADDVFTLKESDYSSSILAINIDETNSDWPFSIYTSNFYERVDKPGRNPKIFLDQWSSYASFRHDANLMIDFIQNLQNKTLKIMTFDYDPYTHFEPLDGTEIKLIQEFCKKHNCSLVAVDDGHYWGDIFENGTSDGLAGMVYDGRADFGAAAVYLWLPYFYFVDYSTSYLYSASTLLVPKPHPVSGWRTPFLPFDMLTWISYGLSVLMAAVFMYVITYLTVKYTRFAEAVQKRRMFLDKLDCIFRALGLAVLQQPSTPLVPHTPIRHLFTSFEFLFLIASSIYAAELASYLTVPRYEKPIDTLIEYSDSGMIWIGEHESWTYSLRGMTDPEIVNIVNNYLICSHEKLMKLAPTGEYGLIVERLPGGHYTEQDHVTDDIVAQSHMMAENLFGSPPVIAVRKGSPYRKYFNKVISNVLCGGLYLYWEGEMSRKYLHSRRQLALREADHPHYKDIPKNLEISHIQGGLFLYAIGATISIFVFMFELFFHYRKMSRKFIRKFT